jgi:hypothetical protein
VTGSRRPAATFMGAVGLLILLLEMLSPSTSPAVVVLGGVLLAVGSLAVVLPERPARRR